MNIIIVECINFMLSVNFNFIFASYILRPILIQIQIISVQLQALNLNLLDTVVSIVNV